MELLKNHTFKDKIKLAFRILFNKVEIPNAVEFTFESNICINNDFKFYSSRVKFDLLGESYLEDTEIISLTGRMPEAKKCFKGEIKNFKIYNTAL